MFKQQMEGRRRNLMIAISDYLRLPMFGSDRQIGGRIVGEKVVKYGGRTGIMA